MSKKPPQLGELAAQNIEGFLFFSKHIGPFQLNKSRHYNESGSDEQENSCPIERVKSMKAGTAFFLHTLALQQTLVRSKRRSAFKVNLRRKRKKYPTAEGSCGVKFRKIYKKNFVSCLPTEGVLNTHPAATPIQFE